MELSVVTPMLGRFVTRASMDAPFDTSFRTNSGCSRCPTPEVGVVAPAFRFS